MDGRGQVEADRVMQSTTPLTYETPRAPAAPRWYDLINWKVLVGTLIVVLALLLAAVAIVPPVEQIYLDFNARLPLLTQLVLGFSRWVRLDWGWVYLLGGPVVLGLIVRRLRGRWGRQGADEHALAEHRRLLAWGFTFLGVGFILLVILALLMLALFAPMVVMFQSVSG